VRSGSACTVLGFGRLAGARGRVGAVGGGKMADPNLRRNSIKPRT
jgi:hypothetical protein